MSVLILQTRTDGNQYYDFDTQLDGTTYTLEFQWNERDSSWYCALYAAGGALLCSAVRVVLGWPLFNRPGLRDTPPGEIMAIDSDDSGIEAGLYDLGSRVLLCYIEEGTF